MSSSRFLLFVQKKRHAAARTVAARVKSNPASFEQFATWVSDKHFVSKLRTAREHPDRPESKELLQLLNKHISLFQDKIPFTAAARHASMGHLYAMIYYLGFPSDFGTFAIDDIYGQLNIRLGIRPKNNNLFPAVDGGLTNALKGTLPLPARQHGISGTITGAFGCLETQDCGSLHMHFVTFGSLTPALLQSASGILFTLPAITALLERKQAASLHPITH